jgi:hypothetical protein
VVTVNVVCEPSGYWSGELGVGNKKAKTAKGSRYVVWLAIVQSGYSVRVSQSPVSQSGSVCDRKDACRRSLLKAKVFARLQVTQPT